MRLQLSESNGSAEPEVGLNDQATKLKEYKQHSTSLPFGQFVPLKSISGPTYVTAQTLVQQVAYSFSDSLWTFSPESFDLDIATKNWKNAQTKNIHGFVPKVQSMEIRQGAATVALGYIFSKDFDLNKRHIPQGIIASSSALPYLHSALDQLSLLYSVANPFVAHVAAADYAGDSSQLVTDYAITLSTAEELGLGVVSSYSAYEAQHMSLFATLLADYVPMVHIYDGIGMARETTRVIDVLDQTGLQNTYAAVQQEMSKFSGRRRSLDDKAARLMQFFNEELGTEYGLFEYEGAASPESVLVVFGTAESSLGVQVASSLVKDGTNVGVLSVRVYRPFVEEEFIRLLPESVKTIGVLGQVQDYSLVADPSAQSALFKDVIATTSFSSKWKSPPDVIDIKYPRETIWTPLSISASFQYLLNRPVLENQEQTLEAGTPPLQLLDPAITQQFTFWDIDASVTASAPTIIGRALAAESASNVTVNTNYDNLLQGGVVRTDIRKSRKSIEASYSIDSADVVYVGEVSLLNHFDILTNLATGGKVIVRMPNVKEDEVEKKLPLFFRRGIVTKKAALYTLNPVAIQIISDTPSFEVYATQIALLRVALPNLEAFGLRQLSALNGSLDLMQTLAGELDKALRLIEIPEDWQNSDTNDLDIVPLPPSLRPSSFEAFDKTETEPPSYLKSWQTAARGLAFKEAYGTEDAVRPDLGIKTHIVHVKENRRLTPLTYDRNIFHIEFDLGDSGLTYDIGEALGIHAENDDVEVADFIQFYGLDSDEIVEVASREDPQVLENRTVWQALKQNVDIFGRPPKRFYEALAGFADDPDEEKELRTLGGSEGANEFKRRAEVDTVTFADILLEFSSARPSFHDIVRIISPMKRREYSIASCQKVTPKSVALMIVVVGWVDPKGRDRFGQATRFLNRLKVGAPVTVSIKPSVMKLPPKSTQPLIMAGLGTGLAPFRAFVQHRALEKAEGKDIGSVLLYMGSRHQREEYCYGEEWEAYQDAGVITLLGRAFSRDQPQKIYIQDRMRQTIDDIVKAYLHEEGAFYLCKFTPRVRRNI